MIQPAPTTPLFGFQADFSLSLPASAQRAIEADFAAAAATVNAIRPWVQIGERWQMGGGGDNTATILSLCNRAAAEGKVIVPVVAPVQRNGRTYQQWAPLALPPSLQAVADYANQFCDLFGALPIVGVEVTNEPQFASTYFPGSKKQLLDIFNAFADVLDARGVPVLSPSYNGTNLTDCQAWIGPMIGRCAGVTLHPYSPRPGQFVRAVQSWCGLPVWITELGSHTQFRGPAQWAADRGVALAECAAAGVACVIDFPGIFSPHGDESQGGIVNADGSRREPFYSAPEIRRRAVLCRAGLDPHPYARADPDSRPAKPRADAGPRTRTPHAGRGPCARCRARAAGRERHRAHPGAAPRDRHPDAAAVAGDGTAADPTPLPRTDVQRGAKRGANYSKSYSYPRYSAANAGSPLPCTAAIPADPLSLSTRRAAPARGRFDRHRTLLRRCG